MLVMLEVRFKCDNDLHPLNPLDPIVLRVTGKSISDSFAHPLNASFPIICNPSLRIIEQRSSQLANALSSIFTTVSGI